jgi:D-glycero-D-manno-heptose 1,7-bisphosphate phosphatase
VKPALLLDRDGTLIVDVGYPRDPERVELLPGAAEALVELQRHFCLVIISNQSGLGRGKITAAEAAAVHRRVLDDFASLGVQFAGAYYCPHAPEAGCPCRKPATGLVVQAAAELGLELAASVMIGDKAADVELGQRAGCRATVRFGDAPAPGDAPATRHCSDWRAVRHFIASLAEAGY